MNEQKPELLEIIAIHSSENSNEKLFSWSVPSGNKSGFTEIRDEWWSGTFGELQSNLHQTSTKYRVIVNFSAIAWIDPIPLLSIFIAIKSFCSRTSSTVILQLGHEPGRNQRRSGFLKFLGQHGFLASFHDVPEARVMFEDKEYSLESDSPLWARLASETFMLTYSDSRCLTAKIISITSLGAATDKDITNTIKPWLDEFRDYGLKPYFEGEAELVDDMLHKVRVLLTEIVHNAGEHAYLGKDNPNSLFFGVYARVRHCADLKEKSALLTEAIQRESSDCPTLKQFHRDNQMSWIEIFYVDEGRGLLADLDVWEAYADKELKAKIAKIKPETNALHKISRYFFQHSITRHNRDKRTTLTGLQHVRLVLSDGEDFARVYTGGEWAGAVHPWSPRSLAGNYNSRKQKKYAGFKFSEGTAWHYCLRLGQTTSNAKDHRFDDWIQFTAADVERAPAGKTTYDSWCIFDERDLGKGVNYREWNAEKINAQYSLWLPGAVTKQHVYQWLTSTLAQRSQINVDKSVWIIADLSREQAQTLMAVLLSERAQHAAPIEVYLVTSDWHLICLKTQREDRSFYAITKKDSGRVVKERGADIFNLLRSHDSKLFWDGLIDRDANPVGSAFIHEEVIWGRDDASDLPSVVLRGYLDLTHALVDPLRAAVAARALRRTWYLYARNAECVAADALLTNLLPREARLTLTNRTIRSTEEPKAQVIVSSILVTGSTAGGSNQADRQAIHLLRHTQFVHGENLIKNSVKTSNCFALNWAETAITITPRPTDELPYERIPGTPYIGRGGPKAIPIRRFEYKSENGEYFSNSIYKESPQETYDHFLNLGLLKLGHWVYGTHHDLLTINLGLAVDRESLDHGPILKWLCAELQELKKLGSELVVYSSHPVTEKMVQAIKKSTSSGVKYDLPEYFIPVHFLGTHTQTAIRIPSLTYDRIREFLRDETRTEKRVVLLDDGTLTGKVQRELEQLIRNAGAKIVTHVGLVTRTGLPLYRKYLLNEHSDTHRYYWRWDVPPLGSARTCPLCRSLEQARELAHTLWSEQAKSETEGWTTAWLERTVTTHWWRHGLTPAQLPESRQITFGKEWQKNSKDVMKYPIRHTTTTGLASTVAELIRITSYKEVGAKIARQPWPKEFTTTPIEWRRAQLEILICQTLLFFDDFDQQELDSRFEMIFETLLVPDADETDQAIDRLACLTLLLTSDRQARFLIEKNIHLLARAPIVPLHILITFGLLARRARLSLNDQRQLVSASGILKSQERIAAEDHVATAYTLARGEADRGTRHALMTLIMLLGKNEVDAHTGFLRKKIVGDIEGRPADIARDMRFAAQAMREIDSLVLTGSAEHEMHLEKYSSTIIELADSLDKHLTASAEASPDEFLQKVHALLFGSTEAIAIKFQSTFLTDAKQINEYLRTAVGSSEWQSELNRRGVTGNARWKRSDESVVLPTFRTKICGSMKDEEVVVCPPIARQMIHDCLLDVFHSDRSYKIGNETYDMLCTLSVSDEIFTIEMRNHASNDSSMSSRKASEAIVSQQILKNPVTRSFDQSSKEMIVTIRLPLVADLGRSNA